MKVCVMGIPGVGKTTLASALAAHFSLPVITAGDIGRAVDPAAIARGDMADERLLREGVLAELSGHPEWVLDGFPRTLAQALLLPPETVVIHLTCRPDIARERLLRRGRADDSTIDKRLAEQSALMEIDKKDGWAYLLAGYGRNVNTSMKSAPTIAAAVVAHLSGQKAECY